MSQSRYLILEKWLDGNSIKMYSTHNEGKSVVAKKYVLINK